MKLTMFWCKWCKEIRLTDHKARIFCCHDDLMRPVQLIKGQNHSEIELIVEDFE